MVKWISFFLFVSAHLSAQVLPGIDVLLETENIGKLQGKRIGLITNQTAVTSRMRSTLEVLKAKATSYKIVKLFAPEHGIKGQGWAGEEIKNAEDESGIPILSLHGKSRRPTAEMLRGIDLLIFDIQDIGSRSYTYATTLFYVMEEAAKQKIRVMILDRPNPIGGLLIDGPMLEEKWRSFVGYVNVPYCHGMTLGELARYFNGEYKVGCALEVIPMKGWTRSMSYRDTGLAWIPTSPNIPEPDTPLYYPMTGILGELGIVSIGIGYTLPFKVFGAPWIQAEKLCAALRRQNLGGVSFRPFYFRPFYGKYAEQNCEGVLLSLTEKDKLKPIQVQYAIIDTLKKLYPQAVKETLKGASKSQIAMFNKVNGTEAIWHLLNSKEGLASSYKMQNTERKRFEEARKKYLLY